MKKIEACRYTPSEKNEWDTFVRESRNATFLFMRDYMDYHSDRYNDHSLIFRSGGRPVALLPANENGETVFSHGGLTYGGLLLPPRCGGAEVMHLFDAMARHFGEYGIRRIIYKPVPHIYHLAPSEEELYALYRYGARLAGRALSATISTAAGTPHFAKLRTRCIKKGIKNGVTVREETDFAPFWQVLTENLSMRHGVSPVHTIDEITLLKSRFPENIRLYISEKGSELLAGAVIYETPRCTHVQYIASTPGGREEGALDVIFSTLITERYSRVPYFDFGISTEQGGSVLNEGLLRQKEGFGATGTVYDTYEVELKTTNREFFPRQGKLQRST